MSPSKPLAREFEYKRHGTQTLIASINVATGKIQGVCGDTRKEEDFNKFVERTIESNPGCGTYHFVADQLNTHKSESLVRFVATHCEIDEDLGLKRYLKIHGDARVLLGRWWKKHHLSLHPTTCLLD